MAKSAYPQLHKALKFATKAHKKQDREGADPLPYVTHPIEVLTAVRHDGDMHDEDVLCAAVLHDVLEETDTKASTIEAKFGERVAQLVMQLTRQEPDEETKKLPEEELWKIRTGIMLAEIDRMSNEAKLIKLADRYSNLRHYAKPPERLQRYLEQSKLILEHINRELCPILWDRVQQLSDGVVPQGAGEAKRKNLKNPA